MSIEWLTSWSVGAILLWLVLLPVALIYAAVKWLIGRNRK